jgi:hypothetical protein
MRRKIERDLRRAFPFVRIETTGGNHLRLRLPNGKTVIASNTPSCSLYMRNIRSDVRRAMREAK